MKRMKKLIALLMTMVMVLGMGTSAFADAQGQGTLTVSNAMKGQTYTAYKVFNAVYADPDDPSAGVVYTVPSGLESKVSNPFSVGTAVASNGEKIVALADGTTDATVLQWVKDNYSKFDTTGTVLTYNETDGTAGATLDYGYYYITSSLGTVVSIDSVNSAVTVVDKNESKPEGPAKIITAEDSSIIAGLDQTDKELESNEAAVGSVESFQVTFQATNWVEDAEADSTAGTGTGTKTKVTVWNFTDTPTGLNINTSTVKITVNGTTIYDAAAGTTTAATVTGGGTQAMQISIPWVNEGGASIYETTTEGSELIPVVVTYNATVTSAAATAAAPNEVKVKYNNTTSTGTDTTTTYTYKFQLDKTKKDFSELLGAKFQLYASDGTTPLKFDKSGTTYTYNASGMVDTIDMTTSAKVLIQGLDKAEYVLKEIQAPAGYNKAADQTIGDAVLVRVDETITDEAEIANDEGVATIVNEQGTELPSTGGMGTTIFYIVGAVLVIGAAVLLISKRRMDDR